MTAPRLFFFFTVAIASLGCQSPKPINVMTMAPVCDSTPAQPDPAATPPTLPSFTSTMTGYAAVIGTVEEAISRHPLPGGVIDLYPADSTNAQDLTRKRIYTDQFARFALDSITPGIYLLKARFIAHQPLERRVNLRAEVTDTTRFSLRRYSCVGY